MKTHFEHLMALIPTLVSADILDVGSGRGKFMVEAAQRGARVSGVEPYAPYIEEAERRMKEAGVSVNLKEGVAEAIPFPDATFDFVNAAEVIEHVESPEAMLSEVARVLRSGGFAYISVPNRFGFKDPHFRLYLVNWLPRSFTDSFISVFGSHKDYSEKGNGRQRLADMHYYTLKDVRGLIRRTGLEPEDIRARRIAEMPMPQRFFAATLYPAARAFYFDSFHLLLTKPVSPARDEAVH